MTQDSDQAMEAAVRATPAELAVEMSKGMRFLTGRATVVLVLNVDAASTPQEAVELTAKSIINGGINQFFFEVIDQGTGEKFHVKAGQIVNLPDASGT